MPPRWLGPIGIGALLVSAVIVGVQAWNLLRGGSVGVDFLPLRDAGKNLVDGRSVFTNRSFVYPPTAAAVFTPLALGSTVTAYRCWVLLSLAALVLAAVMIARTGAPSTRRLRTAATIVVLAGGCVATDCLDLGNVSAFLVPVAAYVLIAFDRGRWRTGCAILALSLLVKPLLLPLLLVPAVRRRWTDLGITLVPAGLGLLAAVVFLPDGRHFWPVIRYDLAGTNLRGTLARNNLSLSGWAAAHGASSAAAAAASMMVAGVALAALLLQLRAGTAEATCAELGGLAMLTVMLGGATNEVHYLFTPVAIAVLQLSTRPSRRGLLLLLPGVAMLALPLGYVQYLADTPTRFQTWCVAAEVALYASTIAGLPVFTPRRHAARRAIHRVNRRRLAAVQNPA